MSDWPPFGAMADGRNKHYVARQLKDGLGGIHLVQGSKPSCRMATFFVRRTTEVQRRRDANHRPLCLGL